ncbi:hypothetical protein [Ruminococcus sp.]|jgi:hypothetical protein|uniref:hypothetical protein n=1 Tax=Ruminococcus sp. TaxID=41978 RepID=UPI0025DC252B|nr:hypothetical protein [Ruminococcus sp.]
MIISFSLVGITLFAGLIDSFAFIMLPLVLMIVFIIWLTDIVKSTQPNNDLMILSDYVRVPDGVIGYKNMSYDMIAKMFENAGFHNIQLVPMGDVVLGVFNTPNLVDRILINNEMIIQGGGTYSPWARVVIYYHSSKF